MLDGSEAFGKGTGASFQCIAPVVYMLLGAQLATYLREMGGVGGESKGRLRFIVMTLDSTSIRQTPFEDKFLPRRESNGVLIGVLREILRAQQIPKRSFRSAAAELFGEDSAAREPEQAAAPAPAAAAAEGTTAAAEAAAAAAAVADTHTAADAGRPRGPRARRSRLEGKQSAAPAGPHRPQRRAQLNEDRAANASASSGSLVAASPVEPAACSAISADRVLEVPTMSWTATAGVVLAGVNDGANAALIDVPDAAGASVIIKHVGKVFGSTAVSNVACRNGLLRYALDAAVPLDPHIRSLDAFAALSKTELYTVNQLRIERLLAQRLAETSKGPSREEPGKVSEAPPSGLSPVDLAARRFFDALTDPSGPVDDDGQSAWSVAVGSGVPLAVNAHTIWYNFRQLFFSRKRKRCASLSKYGGIDNLNSHGGASGWRALLEQLVVEGVAVKTEDYKRILVQKSLRGSTYLKKLEILLQPYTEYSKLPAAQP